MKRVLIVLAVLILLVVAGVGIFLATFDADRYRPRLVNEAQRVLGRPVRVEHLALGWRGGLALQLKGLAIYEDERSTGEPLLQVDEVSAVIRLLPLLRKEVQVSAILLDRPHAHLSRDAQGQITAVGPAAASSSAATSAQTAHPSPAGPSGPAVSVNVDVLAIRDGVVHWTDATTQPPRDLRIKNLDVTLRDVSLTRPIRLEARMAWCSRQPNIRVTGRVLPPSGGHPVVFEDVKLTTDLSQLDLTELGSALPAIKSAGLRPGLAGHLVVTIGRLALDPAGLKEATAQLTLADGRVALAQLASPLEMLTLKLQAHDDRLEITQCTAKVAEGTITASSTVEHLSTVAQSTVHLTADRLALSSLLPVTDPREPQLRGRLSVSFEGSASGLDWPMLRQTLSGTGTIGVRDGVIANLNVVDEVFRRISIIPGLAETLRARLPASYQQKLAAQDTVLQPIDLAVRAQNGTILFQDVQVATETFQLTGTGQVGLDGMLASRLMLRLDPDFSAAIVQSVKALQNLEDAQGRLELPVVLQGNLPRVSVVPDVQYVAQRLVTVKAQELIGNFLEKALEKRGLAPNQDTNPRSVP